MEEEYPVSPPAIEEASSEEINQHLGILNANWLRYNDILANRITFDSSRERGQAAQLARQTYAYEELWLAQHGYPWHLLAYNKESRTYSLPDECE